MTAMCRLVVSMASIFRQEPIAVISVEAILGVNVIGDEANIMQKSAHISPHIIRCSNSC